MMEFDSNESELRKLRAKYCNEVKQIRELLKELMAGRSDEEISNEELEWIARQGHSRRRDTGLKYKELTPQQELEAIYDRNRKIYGDRLGPTIEYLRAIGKTWMQIIESASRPNEGDINDII